MCVAFSAASNVTGVLTDTVAVAELCHKYGALSFWDYASAGPYLNIDMNPTQTGRGEKIVYLYKIYINNAVKLNCEIPHVAHITNFQLATGLSVV